METTAIQPDTLVEYDAEQKRKWENLLPTVKVEGEKDQDSVVPALKSLIVANVV